jgi:hypothetical protein
MHHTMTGAGVKAGTEDCCRGQMAIGLASGSLLVVLTMTILLAGDVPFSSNEPQGLNNL